jgi:hypothetical protein
MNAPVENPLNANTKTLNDDFNKVNDKKKSSKNWYICCILTIIAVVVTIIALTSSPGYDINEPINGF